MTTKLEGKKLNVPVSPILILIKKKESLLLKEISFLEKNMSDYKAERKASWKTFKNKMETDLNKIRQSIEEISNYEN
jgi:hypothetical protein